MIFYFLKFNLSREDFDVVSRIIYSPRIERWAGGAWQRLIIDKGETEINTFAPTAEIEITFDLPPVQMQY